MIRVLIAEDSPVVAEILKHLFDAEDDLAVVAIARDGEQAVKMAADLRPDIITMDVMMPKLDGVAAIEMIMEETPTPIVVVSSHVNDREMRVSFRSLAAGALSVLEKPEAIFTPGFESRRKAFVDTVRAMATVKVVRRRKRAGPAAARLPSDVALPPRGDYAIVALGSSTGGPQALNRILAALPVDFPLPLVIAQHISRGFTPGLVDWLGAQCAIPMVLAADGEPCRKGYAYFAPDGTNIGVVPAGDGYRLSVSGVQRENVLTPSVDRLFTSVADAAGDKAICGLLTGMGRDGAEGLAAVRGRGGYTFAEAEESCVVYGMPAAAVANGAARAVVPLDHIGAHLMSLAGLASRILV